MTRSTVVPCDRMGDRLSAMLDDPTALSVAESDHLGQCLRCQADLARLRRLRRVLVALRHEPVPTDPDLLEVVLDGIESSSERRDRHRVTGRRAASLVGLAAATAAGVGGVLVLATRRRSA